jgi:hypothetical protein
VTYARDTAPPATSFTPTPAGQLHRCACGGTADGGGECAACRARRLQRQATGSQDSAREVPGSVREVLREPGQPLDRPVRAVMEARLGHDFGRVRVHTGERAAESARALHASAYTVGSHVTFDRGRYDPGAQVGRELLAHELAHVAQNSGAALPEAGTLRVAESARHEAEAAAAARTVGSQPRSGEPLPAPDPGAASGAVRLSPDVSPSGGISLQFDETGRVTVTVVGPDLPIVGGPAIGLRRNADGSYQLVAGGKGKVVAAGDIPGLLRQAVAGAGKAGKGPTVAGFRFPTCDRLRAPDGTRLMTFLEYKVSQMLSTDLLPLTPPLYDAILEVCQSGDKKTEPEPPLGPGDFPERTQSEGTDVA